MAPGRSDGGAGAGRGGGDGAGGVEGNEQCIYCLEEGAQTYDACSCEPAPAHLACIVDSASSLPVGPQGWTHCVACGQTYKAEVQLALARGLVVKVAGRPLGDPERLAAHTVLGTVLLQQGCCTEAVDVFQTNVAAYHHAHGPAHPDALMAAGNLGAALSSVGSHTEAVQIFRETWSTMKIVAGAEHPATMNIGVNLAVALRKQGGLGEAAEMHRSILAAQRATLGVHHPDTLLSAAKFKIIRDMRAEVDDV